MILAGHLIPGEPLADDLRSSLLEPFVVVHLFSSIVEAVGLFVQISKQMLWFHAHIGSAESAF